MKIIKLTKCEKQNIFVNVDSIISIEALGRETLIRTNFSALYVKETPEQILEIINEG